jgi:hypothetical protein
LTRSGRDILDIPGNNTSGNINININGYGNGNINGHGNASGHGLPPSGSVSQQSSNTEQATISVSKQTVGLSPLVSKYTSDSSLTDLQVKISLSHLIKRTLTSLDTRTTPHRTPPHNDTTMLVSSPIRTRTGTKEAFIASASTKEAFHPGRPRMKKESGLRCCEASGDDYSEQPHEAGSRQIIIMSSFTVTTACRAHERIVGREQEQEQERGRERERGVEAADGGIEAVAGEEMRRARGGAGGVLLLLGHTAALLSHTTPSLT